MGAPAIKHERKWGQSWRIAENAGKKVKQTQERYMSSSRLLNTQAKAEATPPT